MLHRRPWRWNRKVPCNVAAGRQAPVKEVRGGIQAVADVVKVAWGTGACTGDGDGEGEGAVAGVGVSVGEGEGVWAWGTAGLPDRMRLGVAVGGRVLGWCSGRARAPALALAVLALTTVR